MGVAPDAAELLEIAIAVARPAAGLARSMRADGVEGVSTKSTATDVVTAADLDGEVVAGVVRNAATGHEWTATRGGGAFRDGRRLTGSQVTDLSQALLATGFGYGAARRAHQARVLARLLVHVR